MFIIFMQSHMYLPEDVLKYVTSTIACTKCPLVRTPEQSYSLLVRMVERSSFVFLNGH